MMSYFSYLDSFDALHFEHIAEFGYTHEKNHAFFPGYPWLLHHINKFAMRRLGQENVEQVQLVTNLLVLALHLILGSINVVLLFDLVIKMFNNQFFKNKAIEFSKAEKEKLDQRQV